MVWILLHFCSLGLAYQAAVRCARRIGKGSSTHSIAHWVQVVNILWLSQSSATCQAHHRGNSRTLNRGYQIQVRSVQQEPVACTGTLERHIGLLSGGHLWAERVNVEKECASSLINTTFKCCKKIILGLILIRPPSLCNLYTINKEYHPIPHHKPRKKNQGNQTQVLWLQPSVLRPLSHNHPQATQTFFLQ